MPKPKKYLTDDEIEETAASVLDAHITGGRKEAVLPIDVDTLTECSFRFKVVWERIDDPPGCKTFASLIPTEPGGIYAAKLTLNENYFDYLSSHLEIERLTRAHELCHWINHIDLGELQTGLLPFDKELYPAKFHRTSYAQQALTADKKNRLARHAFDDERAYRILKPRENDFEARIEPAWMHRQAEHFAACLLIPRQPLLKALESIGDLTFYGTHVELARLFQVSRRVIQIRLMKLAIIQEIEPGQFSNVHKSKRLAF
jgi:hypothetical protein